MTVAMDSQHILVPVDFSPASEAAARLAVGLAARVSGRVTLAHVESLPGAALLSVEPIVIPPAVWEEIAGDSRKMGQERLDKLQKDLAAETPGVTIESTVLSGSAVEVVLEAARDANFIVMGSHGATGAERLFFGSVAEAVSRQATCPVLVTRDEARHQFERVVAGVDLGDASLEVAKLAKQFVAVGGTLEVVYVLGMPQGTTVEAALTGAGKKLQALIEEARERAVEAMDSLVEQVGSDVIKVVGVVETGRVEVALLARAEKAGMVVVGAHSRERLRERVLGTTADRVLRHSTVPVLLLPRND